MLSVFMIAVTHCHWRFSCVLSLLGWNHTQAFAERQTKVLKPYGLSAVAFLEPKNSKKHKHALTSKRAQWNSLQLSVGLM